jgi:hypothetical protein
MILKSIKFAVLALGISFSSLSNAANVDNGFDCNDIKNMTMKQKVVLYKAYYFGLEDDLGYSLAAIAWQESEAGKILVNAFDPSFGIYHTLLSSAAVRESKQDATNYEKNIIAQELIDSQQFASKHAIAEMKYWLSKHNGNYMKAWASYNAGHKMENGKSYASSISSKIGTLKKCLLIQPIRLK